MRVYDVRAEFEGGYTGRRSSTPFIVVHHAASLYRTRTGIEDVRSVHTYHTKTRGWPGIGYHEALAEEVEGGEIAAYVCSDPMLMRAGVLNQNHAIYSIAALTNFDDKSVFPDGLPTEKWRAAIGERVRNALRMFPNARVVGHKEITVPGGETACPGTKWSGWKADLIKRATSAGDELPVLAAPRISLAQFRDVLGRKNPAVAPEAEAIYNAIAGEGVDPAVGLAFFAHESSYGTAGICATYNTRNWGNVRTPHRKDLSNGSIDAGGGFATYATWTKGAHDWALRIKEAYAGTRGLSTVEQILPVYAPFSDKNDPGAYARAVRRLVEDYKAVKVQGLVVDGIPVDPAFEKAYLDSGGATWVAGKLFPGKPLEHAFLHQEKVHQLFERGALRKNADGSLDWLFTDEIAALKVARLETLQNL